MIFWLEIALARPTSQNQRGPWAPGSLLDSSVWIPLRNLIDPVCSGEARLLEFCILESLSPKFSSPLSVPGLQCHPDRACRSWSHVDPVLWKCLNQNFQGLTPGFSRSPPSPFLPLKALFELFDDSNRCGKTFDTVNIRSKQGLRANREEVWSLF